MVGIWNVRLLKNKNTACRLNNQLKEQETDCQNRLKQAQMQADLAMEQAVCSQRQMEEFRKLDRENARLIAEPRHFGHLLMLLQQNSGILKTAV